MFECHNLKRIDCEKKAFAFDPEICTLFRKGKIRNTCESGYTSMIDVTETLFLQRTTKGYFIKESILWTGQCSYIFTLVEANDPEIPKEAYGTQTQVEMFPLDKKSYKSIEYHNGKFTATCKMELIDEQPSQTLYNPELILY